MGHDRGAKHVTMTPTSVQKQTVDEVFVFLSLPYHCHAYCLPYLHAKHFLSLC